MQTVNCSISIICSYTTFAGLEGGPLYERGKDACILALVCTLQIYMHDLTKVNSGLDRSGKKIGNFEGSIKA